MPAQTTSSTAREIADLMVESMRARMLLRPEPWLALDITLLQFKALVLLGTRGATRPGEIADALGVLPASVTGILDRLEDRELTQREPDPSDRRCSVIRATPTGEAMLEQIYASGRDQVVEVLSGLDGADLAALQQGMTALIRGLRIRLADQRAAVAGG